MLHVSDLAALRDEQMAKPLQRLDHETFRTNDPEALAYLTQHVPPRPAPIWFLLRQDLKSLSIYLFYGPPLALVISLGWWFGLSIAGIGFVILLSIYVLLFRSTVNTLRNGRLVLGKIQDYEDHALTDDKVFRDWRFADAQLEDGRIVPVSFDDPGVRDVLGNNPIVELLVIDDGPIRDGQSYSAIGYRPASEH